MTNDPDLRFKDLTIDNWLEPDPTLDIFVRFSAEEGAFRGISAEERAQDVLAPQLDERVPLEIRRLFEVARGALLYGYFFYPLFTLGTEQLHRVVETAVKRKCEALGAPSKTIKNYAAALAFLRAQGVIEEEGWVVWDAGRQLRNLASHPDDQTILPPGSAIATLRRTADAVNGLFERA